MNESKQRFHCNQCRENTWHECLSKASKSDSIKEDDEYEIFWHNIYQVFACCGCGSALFMKTYSDSEFNGPDVQFFPPRASRHLPEWSNKLPFPLQKLLLEIYNSLNADNRSLPMMGARAVLDMVLVEKVGDVDSFSQKLKKFQDQGFISEKNREVLDAALEAGHASSHRGYDPSINDINIVMDIVENFLQATYVLDEAAKRVKKSTPKRPEKSKESPMPSKAIKKEK